MSDLVERLRNRSLALKSVSRQTVTTKYDAELSDEAADEIERLRRELAEAKRQIDFGIHQSDLDRIGVNARRQAFIEAAEIAENMTLGFEGNDECRAVNRNIRKVAKEIRHRAEETQG